MHLATSCDKQNFFEIGTCVIARIDFQILSNSETVTEGFVMVRNRQFLAEGLEIELAKISKLSRTSFSKKKFALKNQSVRNSKWCAGILLRTLLKCRLIGVVLRRKLKRSYSNSEER